MHKEITILKENEVKTKKTVKLYDVIELMSKLYKNVNT